MAYLHKILMAAVLGLASLSLSGRAEAACGELGASPCNLFSWRFAELGDFCEPDLVHVPFLVCRPRFTGHRAQPDAGEVARLTLKISEALFNGPHLKPQLAVDLVRALERKDVKAVMRLLEDQTSFDEVMDLMSEIGLRSAAIGISGGGSLIKGGGGEAGVVMDNDRQRPPYGYSVDWQSIGLQAGFGGDLVVTGLVAETGCIGGQAFGIGGYVDYGPGAGIISWHGRDGVFAGLSLAVGIAGIGGGVAEFTGVTKLPRAPCPYFTASNPPPPPPPEPVLVTVVPGDTLWAISAGHLGDGRRYPEIFAENTPPLRDPDLIRPGQILTIPVQTP